MDLHHHDVARMTVWGEWFARLAITNQKPGFVILEGRPGCGKTRIAKRVARFIRDYAFDAYAEHWGSRGRLPSVEFRDWPKMVEQKPDDYDESVLDLYDADVVILDDMGAEADQFKSGLPISRLRSLLSRLERKAVMITTNVRSQEWEKRDERIASRLSAANRFSAFAIPDYRPRAKDAREQAVRCPDPSNK